MANSESILVPVTNVRKAMKESGEKDILLPKGKTSIRLNLTKVSRAFLECLLRTSLHTSVKNRVGAYLSLTSPVTEGGSLFTRMVDSPKELWMALQPICQDSSAPNMEVLLPNGVWYPVVIQVYLQSGLFSGEYCLLRTNFKIADHSQNFDIPVFGPFVDSANNPVKRKVSDVLESRGLRELTEERKQLFREKQKRVHNLGKAGTLLDCTSGVLFFNEFLWMSRLDYRTLGSVEAPSQVIIEPSLESSGNCYNDEVDSPDMVELPVIRVFSLDLKKYVYVDVDSVKVHEYTTTNRERIVLPENIRSILNSLFESCNNSLFSDAFTGRHGGMVILANGPSGVGKTLTAEVFSQTVKRPLYVLEVGELGTDVASVEKNLERIFARAARWDATLLFDEADIFLSRRTENDLERNAIVGVFLRLLDYYRGTFFLTTNRAEVLDPAFQSRITLKLDYPELNRDSRLRIWKTMLKAAGFKVDSLIDSRDLDLREVAGVEINGRQIRNQVRLLTILHPDRQITTEDVKHVLQFVAR